MLHVHYMQHMILIVRILIHLCEKRGACLDALLSCDMVCGLSDICDDTLVSLLCHVTWCGLSDICDDTLLKVCRCSELVKRSVMMLSLSSKSSSSTTARQLDLKTSQRDPNTLSNTSRHVPDTPLNTSTHGPDTPSSSPRTLTDTGVNTGCLSGDGTNIPAKTVDLASISDPASEASSKLNGGPATQTPAVALLSSGARESSQQDLLLVSQAIDDLCQVVCKHLSDHRVISSASTSATSTSSSRRMLPIVPGTSTLPPGAALLATPGSVLSPGSSLAASMVHCQSSRSGDRTLSRHISMMCFPLRQLTNELWLLQLTCCPHDGHFPLTTWHHRTAVKIRQQRSCNWFYVNIKMRRNVLLTTSFLF